jgi:hypothetical protein
VAQIVSRGGPRTASAGVVTVADLLSRNAPVPVRIPVDDTRPGVTVGSLLRREGRAPHAVDRPVQPRPHQQADESAVASPTGKRVLARRGAVAAGTLLVAGSVFGAAALTDASSNGGQDGVTGPYPGQGRLDAAGDLAAGPAARQPTTVIDPTAVSGALDAGTAAPQSWIPVAFPGAGGVPGGPAGAAPALAGIPGAPGTPGVGPATGDTGGTSGATGGQAAAPGGQGQGASSDGRDAGAPGGRQAQAQDSASDHGLGGTVSNVGKGLGDTAGDLGKQVGGPVGNLAEGAGDAVGGLSHTAGSTLNGLTAPLSARSTSQSRSSDPHTDAADSPSDDSPSADSPSDDGQQEPAMSNVDDGGAKGGGSLLGTVVDGVGRTAAGLLG